jgi:hypothetical protein
MPFQDFGTQVDRPKMFNVIELAFPIITGENNKRSKIIGKNSDVTVFTEAHVNETVVKQMKAVLLMFCSVYVYDVGLADYVSISMSMTLLLKQMMSRMLLMKKRSR